MNENSPSSSIEVAISLSYHSSSALLRASVDPANYLLSVTAEIIEEDTQLKLGVLNFYLIRLAHACDDGTYIPDIFDTHQETYEAGSALFTPDFEKLNKATQKVLSDVWPWEDILLLDRLELNPLLAVRNLDWQLFYELLRTGPAVVRSLL